MPLGVVKPCVNARIHGALVTSSRSSRGTQTGTVRGSIGWLKHRNLASSGQSQIGGLPIGVKLEGRLRIPSAILGGGGIEIRSRSASRDPSGRRAQTRQSRKAFSDAGPRVRILLPPPESRVNFRFLSGGAPSAVRSGIGHECRAHRSANPGPRPSGAYQVSHSTISLPTGRIIGFVECGRALARHGSAEFADLNRVEGYAPDGISASLAH